MAKKEFPKSVDLIKNFGHKKPPVVPHALLIITENIIDRLSCNILNPSPSSIMCLFKHSKIMIKNHPEILQSLLDIALNLREHENIKIRRALRYKACGKYSNDIVFGSFLEFYNRCNGGLRITLMFPVDCWIIIGPEICGTIDAVESKFLKEVDCFLGEYCFINPILKDFFCLTLKILANIMHVSRTRCKPGAYGYKMVQYFLARKFGPLIIEVKCKYCNSVINKLKHRPCIECCEIVRRCGFSLPISAMSNLLQYTSVPFWENTMQNPRPDVQIFRNGELNKKAAFMQYELFNSIDCFFIAQSKSDFNLPNYSSIVDTSEFLLKGNPMSRPEIRKINQNENIKSLKNLSKTISKNTDVSTENTLLSKLQRKVNTTKKANNNLKIPNQAISESRSTNTDESLFSMSEIKMEKKVNNKYQENKPSNFPNQKLTETFSKSFDSRVDSKLPIDEILRFPNKILNQTSSVNSDESKIQRKKDFIISKLDSIKSFRSSVINSENSFLHSISSEEKIAKPKLKHVRSVKSITQKIKNATRRKSAKHQSVKETHDKTANRKKESYGKKPKKSLKILKKES